MELLFDNGRRHLVAKIRTENAAGTAEIKMRVPWLSLFSAAVATDWQTLQEKYAWRPLTPQQRNFVDACETKLRTACPAPHKVNAEALARRIVDQGARACKRGKGRGDDVPFRDMWCVDVWRRTRVRPRSFGHPQGMVYVGKTASFTYLPIPKVATTVVRKWADAMHADDTRQASSFLIQHDAKPVADRLGGAALWRDIPREKRRSMTFSIVRDPLDRHASAWRELRAYERPPKHRRGWGKVVIRQRPFYANASNPKQVFQFLSGKSTDLADEILTRTVRDLACAPDWNEHLTPQTSFFPRSFPSSAVVAPSEALNEVLATVAATSGITSRRASDALAAQKQNARAGWPQARDVFPAFSRGDRTIRVSGPSTVHVWCWLHARDYALLPFTAPRECDGAWAAAGFASGVP